MTTQKQKLCQNFGPTFLHAFSAVRAQFNYLSMIMHDCMIAFYDITTYYRDMDDPDASNIKFLCMKDTVDKHCLREKQSLPQSISR